MFGKKKPIKVMIKNLEAHMLTLNPTSEEFKQCLATYQELIKAKNDSSKTFVTPDTVATIVADFTKFGLGVAVENKGLILPRRQLGFKK